MDSNPEILNVALDLLMEWGPNLGQPILARLQNRFPGLTLAEAQEYDRYGREIRNAAYAIVEKAYIASRESGVSAQTIRTMYPEVSEDNLSHLVSQGMYYAWHENG